MTTNYEKYFAKSPEQLAKEFANSYDDVWCRTCNELNGNCNDKCEENYLAWLKMEAND